MNDTILEGQSIGLEGSRRIRQSRVSPYNTFLEGLINQAEESAKNHKDVVIRYKYRTHVFQCCPSTSISCERQPVGTEIVKIETQLGPKDECILYVYYDF